MKILHTVRLTRTALATAFLAWTAYWTAQAVPMVAATPLGSGAWRPGLQAYEVLEAFFVLAHCGVRWLPVALLLAAGYLWLGRWRSGRGSPLRRRAPAGA
jgi:hypothetical protein